MNKYIFSFIIIIEFSLNPLKSFSQNSGELVYISNNKLNNFLEEEYSLLFHNGFSLFTMIRRDNQDKVSTSEFENEITILNKYPDSLTPKYLTDVLGRVIVYNMAITNDDYKTFVNYTIRDSISLNWNIEPDTSIISNIQCQKATLKFRGRNYIAWFSLEHQLPFGPFKFYGLPGTIVSIEDELKEVSFTLKSIKFMQVDISKDKNRIMNSNLISLKQFKDIQESAVQNSQDEFIRKLQSKMGRGVTVKLGKTQNVNIELVFE